MLSRLLRTIQEHDLIAVGGRVLVGVSGGPDSVALLVGLTRLAPRLSLTLTVASVDHGLRPAAAEEAQSVVRLAHSLGLEGRVLKVDVAPRRRAHHSLQEVAREARLGALADLAGQTGCDAVALGHTADDQAETILFRILRGTGVAGLAGIPYRRGVFIRPLLDVRRGEILAFLRRRKLSYVTDPSNADRRFARARLRHDLLPLLGRENPKITEALLALGRSAAERSPRPELPMAVPGLPAGTFLSRGTRATIARVRAEGRGTQRISVPGGIVEGRYGDLRFLPRAAPPGPLAEDRAVPVPGLGVFRSARGAGLTLRPVPAGTPDAFDLEALRWPLILRAPRPGDRMRPRGGPGRRKLSDLFIDGKIPREQRPSLPVLCDGSGEILYVPRFRPSAFGRPTHMSTKLFVVEEAR